ncbi:MAG: PAS domain-containing protein [Maricaulis sp.]|nr:PAS domain-containing protein [Maricaulis sp.]
MRHPQTRALHAYWQTRRHGGGAPLRADIEPQDISELLGYVFILWRADSQHHLFRLAGTHLCDLYKREFRDQNFLTLWRGHDRTHVHALLEASISGTSPASMIARAVSMDQRELPVEIALFPLRGPSGEIDRTLGLFQPLDSTEGFRGRPVVRTALQEIHPPAQPATIFPGLAQPGETWVQRVANDQ